MTNNTVTLWVGCTSRRYLEGTVHSFEKILSYLGKTLDIIDDTDNACCGSVLYGTGQEAEANANIENTDKLLSEKSVEDMVTMCSGCMKTFGERY
jgi:Fe-S oxidoreductase